MIVLSKRSSAPPCPGSKFPESLIPKWRFINDSVKSPHVPNITTTNDIPTQAAVDIIGKKCANTNETAILSVAPPIEPSHDFFGETRLNRGCFPNKTPVQ